MIVKSTYSITENMGCYDLEIDYEYYHKAPTHYDPLRTD